MSGTTQALTHPAYCSLHVCTAESWDLFPEKHYNVPVGVTSFIC